MSFPASTSDPTPHLGIVLSDGGAPSCCRLLVSLSHPARRFVDSANIYETAIPGSHFGNVFLGSLLKELPFTVLVRMLAGKQIAQSKKRSSQKDFT